MDSSQALIASSGKVLKPKNCPLDSFCLVMPLLGTDCRLLGKVLEPKNCPLDSFCLATQNCHGSFQAHPGTILVPVGLIVPFLQTILAFEWTHAGLIILPLLVPSPTPRFIEVSTLGPSRGPIGYFEDPFWILDGPHCAHLETMLVSSRIHHGSLLGPTWPQL